MRKVISKALVAVMCLSMMSGITQPNVVYADSMPIVTIGANLDETQRKSVLDFFGVDENSVQIIEINNEMEREYLEGILPDSVIGTRTISCSYTMPTTSGGIQVKTANLNVVTDGMLANALLTSGIENCQVVATAPFEVSGTGALTGVFKAYETSSETELSEDKKKLATEELVITGDLINEIANNTGSDIVKDENGEPLTDDEGNYIQQITEAQILALIVDIKVEIINGNLTEERVKEIVDKHLAEYKITLQDETYAKLVDYLSRLSSIDYSDSVKDNLNNLSESFIGSIDKIFDGAGVDFKTDKNSLIQFFENIINWLKELFGLSDGVDEAVDNAKDNITEFTGGIFDTIKQSDDIKIDSGIWSNGDEDSTDTADSTDTEDSADTADSTDNSDNDTNVDIDTGNTNLEDNSEASTELNEEQKEEETSLNVEDSQQENIEG